MNENFKIDQNNDQILLHIPTGIKIIADKYNVMINGTADSVFVHLQIPEEIHVGVNDSNTITKMARQIFIENYNSTK